MDKLSSGITFQWHLWVYLRHYFCVSLVDQSQEESRVCSVINDCKWEDLDDDSEDDEVDDEEDGEQEYSYLSIDNEPMKP